MHTNFRISILPLLIATIIIASGCVGQPQNGIPPPGTTLQPTQTITPEPMDTPFPTPTPAVSPATTGPTIPAIPAATLPPIPARIAITSPQDGQTLVAGDVVVRARVEDFAVAD